MRKKYSHSKRKYNEYFNYMKETSRVVDKCISKEIKQYPNLKEILEKPFHKRLSTKEKTIPKLRSLTLRLAYEITGGKDWKKVVPACGAVELLDTSHYACDDIFDTEIEDDWERNNLIISSHILYSLSQKLIYSLTKNFSTDKVLYTIKESNRLHINIHKGFYSENFILNTLSLKHIWERMKNYTFWDSHMLIGGTLGGGNNEQISSLEKFGNNIGIAYTLANDTCDFAQDCEDLRSGKITLPVYFALKNSKGEGHNKIKKCLGKWNCSQNEIKEATLSAIRNGTITYGKELATYYANKAIEYLNTFNDSKTKNLLIYSTRIVHHNKYYDKLNKLSQGLDIKNKIEPGLKKELKDFSLKTQISEEVVK